MKWIKCLFGFHDFNFVYTHYIEGIPVLNVSYCKHCPQDEVLPPELWRRKYEVEIVKVTPPETKGGEGE